MKLNFFQTGNIVGKSEIKIHLTFKKFDFPSALKTPKIKLLLLNSLRNRDQICPSHLNNWETVPNAKEARIFIH